MQVVDQDGWLPTTLKFNTGLVRTGVVCKSNRCKG